jgi:hypothetical protein
LLVGRQMETGPGVIPWAGRTRAIDPTSRRATGVPGLDLTQDQFASAPRQLGGRFRPSSLSTTLGVELEPAAGVASEGLAQVIAGPVGHRALGLF